MPSQIFTSGGDRLNGARQIVKTSGGALYALVNQSHTANFYVAMFKSTDNGATWTHMDAANQIGATVAQNAQAMAIDGNGVIHCAVVESATNSFFYKTFNTATDLWAATEEPDPSMGDPLYKGVGIAVDSNNKPHIIYARKFSAMGSAFNYVTYINKVSGSWSTKQDFDTTDAAKTYTHPDIAIDNNGFPVISFIQSDKILKWAQGNANTPTGWTITNVESALDVTDTGYPSLAVDSNGVVSVAYNLEGGVLKVYKEGGTITTVDTTVNNRNPALVIDGTTRYIFAKDETNGRIVYYKESSAGVFDTAVGIETGTAFKQIHARWAFNHNQAYTNGIDYIFGDGTNLWYGNLALGAAPEPATANTGAFFAFF